MKKVQSYIGKELECRVPGSTKDRFERKGMKVIAITEPQIVHRIGLCVGIEYIHDNSHYDFSYVELNDIKIK